MTHQLERPLHDSSCAISVLDDLAEREGCHDHHRMRLKVVMQLPLGDEDGVQELLDLGVAGLGIGQDLANEVHETLHFEGVGQDGTHILGIRRDGSRTQGVGQDRTHILGVMQDGARTQGVGRDGARGLEVG